MAKLYRYPEPPAASTPVLSHCAFSDDLMMSVGSYQDFSFEEDGFELRKEYGGY
jgi:hypothetical protein